MFRLAKWLPCMAALAGAFMLGTANPARATFALTLTNGTHTVNGTPTGDTATFSGTVGNFTVTTSNADGTVGAVNSLVESGTTTIVNNSTSTQTLTIKVSQTGFTTPGSPPPVFISDTVSGTVAKGQLVSGTVNAYADASNTLFGTGFASTALSFGPINSGKSFSANGGKNGFLPTGPYSITFVETFQLSAGGKLTLTGGNVTASAPAPASMVMALSGLPFLGLVTWLRRRKMTLLGA